MCRQSDSAGPVSNPGQLEVKLELLASVRSEMGSALQLECCLKKPETQHCTGKDLVCLSMLDWQEVLNHILKIQ